MGISHRLDDLRARMAQAERDAEAMADALASIQSFNARLAAGRQAWFWPTIAAALATKHHWLVIVCEGCGGISDLDLTMKRRHPDAPISIVLRDVRCPRCNGKPKLRTADNRATNITAARPVLLSAESQTPYDGLT